MPKSITNVVPVQNSNLTSLNYMKILKCPPKNCQKRVLTVFELNSQREIKFLIAEGLSCSEGTAYIKTLLHVSVQALVL